MRGSHLLLSKANKNVARAPQNENKVPFKPIFPMALRNRVSGKYDTKSDKGCLYEISVVMACLSNHNYQNKFCNNEVNEFNKCFDNYITKKRATKANQEKGILAPNVQTLNHREVNMLFKKFPIQ